MPPALDDNWREAGFGLYVHWPFCAAKCPYCDFNSHVAPHVDHAAWGRAFVNRIDDLARLTPGRELGSIFFGGGTPSLMPPAVVGAVINAAARHWRFAPDIEITLEANPTSAEAGRFRGYRDAGVNRVSLGVQALSDDDLRALGRLHSAAEALAAVEMARGLFERVSFDLIYARQHQTEAQWEAELRQALGLAPDHLSLYQLTIEPGTAFGARAAAGRLPGLPDEDRAARLYELTQSLCEAAGLPAYEVSNHARTGAESRHNLIYWRGGDWLGAGPGAHGRIATSGQRLAWEDLRSPAEWLDRMSRGEEVARIEAVPAQEMAEEYLMMSLRLAEGASLSRLARLGLRLDAAQIAGFQSDGLVSLSGDRLCATPAGRLVLNRLTAELLAGAA